jgi:hypothetical protein
LTVSGGTGAGGGAAVAALGQPQGDLWKGEQMESEP